ncbi:MAG: extracellular solute-binding protein [Thermomicrobiales bacterium]
MVAGNAPDVIDTWRDDVVKYADRNQILDVDAFVKRDMSAAEVADFHQWQWNDFVLPSGIRFGLPKYVNLMVLWYNKDLLAEAGVAPPDDTWDHTTYAEAAIKLTKKSGDKVDRFGLFYPAYSLDRFSYKLEAFGGRTVDPDDNTKPAFDDAGSQAAEEWIRKLIWDDRAAADRDTIFPGGDGLAATLDAFAAGRVAMVEDGFYPFSIAEAIGDKFKVGFAAVPKGPVKRRVLGTADGFAIWKGSKSPDAAWELLKFLAGPEYQTQLVGLAGYLPNRVSVLSQWKQIVTAKYPNLADSGLDVGPKAMQEGYPGNRPLFKKDAEAQQIIGPALQKVYVSGGTGVDYFKQVAQDVAKSQQG